MGVVDDLSSLVASTPFVVVEDGQTSSSSSCLDLASQAPSVNVSVFTERCTSSRILRILLSHWSGRVLSMGTRIPKVHERTWSRLSRRADNPMSQAERDRFREEAEFTVMLMTLATSSSLRGLARTALKPYCW